MTITFQMNIKFFTFFLQHLRMTSLVFFFELNSFNIELTDENVHTKKIIERH